MSKNVAKKRTYPVARTVESIKIRKLENENYQIASQSTSSGVRKKPGPKSQEGGVWVRALTTPDLNLFENLCLTRKIKEEPGTGLMIQSVTSLNPEYGNGSEKKRAQSIGESTTSNENDNSRQLKRRTVNVIPNLTSTSAFDSVPSNYTNQSDVQCNFKKIPSDEKRLLILNDEDGTKYFACHKCTYAFIKKALLLKHIIAKHTDMLVCKMCCAMYQKRSQLQFDFHIKSHSLKTKAQTNQCPYCMFWVSPNSLSRHMSNHSAVSKYECTLCFHKFFNYDNFKKHMVNSHNMYEYEQ